MAFSLLPCTPLVNCLYLLAPAYTPCLVFTRPVLCLHLKSSILIRCLTRYLLISTVPSSAIQGKSHILRPSLLRAAEVLQLDSLQHPNGGLYHYILPDEGQL